MTDKKQKSAAEISKILAEMPDTETLSKKQLEELTGFSDNTVFKIIEVSGLPTSQREYTVRSLKERFIPARKLLDEGATYDEVKKKMVEVPVKANEQKSDEARFGSALEQLDSEIGGALFEVVKDRVKAATEYLPEMIQAALTEEIESGNTRKILMQRVSASIKQRKGIPLQGSSSLGGLSKFLPKRADSTHLLPPSSDEEQDK